MSTYIFILGKEPELSKAELAARFPTLKFLSEHSEFVMMELADDFDQKQFNRLGGQIKVGRVFSRVEKKGLISNIVGHLSVDYESGKLNFGVSVYGWSEKNLKPLLQDLKKEFKNKEIGSRFANQDSQNLSTAQHKGLRGQPEILVCKELNDFFLAEVVAVQDIDAYSKRDYKKPFRSMKVGMLPPKLAQIMINLTGIDGKIWDPFCGGGVLVMEGLLMGHKMLGSDINSRTLEGAKKNVEWLKNEFDVKSNAELFVHDATKPVPDIQFDAIACEGYLGPPQDELKTGDELAPVFEELSILYSAFFRSLKDAGFKGPVVVGLPFYKVHGGVRFLIELIHEIEEMGFRKDIDLKYVRDDQFVGRQIIRFNLS